MMNKWKIVYTALFLILCMIPSVGLFCYREPVSTENRTLAELPELQTEEGWNRDYLKELGAYFQDHFAFRREMVTANAQIMAKGFGVSANDSVIAGKNHWLYYKDSLEDYQGVELMSRRQLFQVAHTLAMIQSYAGEKGVDFVFTIAPNKNSLYGENMPYYYSAYRNDTNNYARLQPFLKSEGVHYADLFQPLKEKGEEENRILYHKGDSHWNNQGAAIAAEVLLQSLDRSHVSYEDRDYIIRKDYEGDLDAMLFPAAVTKEKEIYYTPGPEFDYEEEVESNFAPKIHTTGKNTGSLVMYRDSFGNALLPFLAEAFGKGYFSRGVPYRLDDLEECHGDTLIIERAERFLPDMAVNPPVMPAPVLSEQELSVSRKDTGNREENIAVRDLEEQNQGIYTKISGSIPLEQIETESRIAVCINQGRSYEAFPVTEEDGTEGFVLYVETETLKEKNQYEILLF